MTRPVVNATTADDPDEVDLGRGSEPLCSIHAVEVVPLDEEQEAEAP
jgi:hypothetical protein